MTQLLDVIPNDAEIEAITKPKNPKDACDLQHRREVKRRLEELLEQTELKRAMGDDFF